MEDVNPQTEYGIIKLPSSSIRKVEAHFTHFPLRSRSCDFELRLSFHLFDGLPRGRVSAGLSSHTTFAGLLSPIRGTCSFQNLLFARIHFTISSVWHSSLIPLLLLRCLSVFPVIVLSTLFSLVHVIFFVSTVAARASAAYVITGLTHAL